MGGVHAVNVVVADDADGRARPDFLKQQRHSLRHALHKAGVRQILQGAVEIGPDLCLALPGPAADQAHGHGAHVKLRGQILIAFDSGGFYPLFFQQFLQSFLTWQYCLILACKNLRIILRQSHFYNSIVLVTAQYDSYRWILIRQLHLPVIVMNIHLHLSNILMLQFADFQIK